MINYVSDLSQPLFVLTIFIFLNLNGLNGTRTKGELESTLPYINRYH